MIGCTRAGAGSTWDRRFSFPKTSVPSTDYRCGWHCTTVFFFFFFFFFFFVETSKLSNSTSSTANTVVTVREQLDDAMLIAIDGFWGRTDTRHDSFRSWNKVPSCNWSSFQDLGVTGNIPNPKRKLNHRQTPVNLRSFSISLPTAGALALIPRPITGPNARNKIVNLNRRWSSIDQRKEQLSWRNSPKYKKKKKKERKKMKQWWVRVCLDGQQDQVKLIQFAAFFFQPMGQDYALRLFRWR